MNKKIIIATGGTGGHIFPAIAVANELKKENIKVLIIGDKKLDNYSNHISVDYKVVSTAKTKTFKSAYFIVKGIVQTFFIFKKEKPDFVIGFGSYASFPSLVAAKLLKIPFALHEQNTCVGKVNRWFQNYAEVIFTSFPEIFGFNINNSEKIKYVGNPIRKNIKVLSNNVYKYPNFENGEKFNIFVVAGSGGASFFGNDFLNFIEYLDPKIIKNIHITHQVREDDLEKVKTLYKNKNISAEVNTFFNDINLQYAKANLVIARAGATTIAELASIGLPTIFIPSPFVANNEQYKNSKLLEKREACIMFKQEDFNGVKFGKLLNELILNKDKLINLSNNIRQFTNINAEINIKEAIKEILWQQI